MAEATALLAVDMGYHVVVVRDRWASNDAENHGLGTTRLPPTIAAAAGLAEVLAAPG